MYKNVKKTFKIFSYFILQNHVSIKCMFDVHTRCKPLIALSF